jgi:hypothetical protein
MSYFTIRLELNNHDEGDYDLLHVEMEQEEMIRVVVASDKKIYALPTATYSQISDQTKEQVFGAATSAVKRVIALKPLNDKGERKDYELIVTEDENPRRFKLKVNTDKSKLPENMTAAD